MNQKIQYSTWYPILNTFTIELRYYLCIARDFFKEFYILVVLEKWAFHWKIKKQFYKGRIPGLKLKGGSRHAGRLDWSFSIFHPLKIQGWKKWAFNFSGSLYHTVPLEETMGSAGGKILPYLHWRVSATGYRAGTLCGFLYEKKSWIIIWNTRQLIMNNYSNSRTPSFYHLLIFHRSLVYLDLL